MPTLKFKNRVAASTTTAPQETPPSAHQDPREEFALMRNKLRIDRNTLDEDMIEQAVYYLDACEAHVQAVSERDAAKENLAVVDARIAQRLRTDWSKKGEKFNETMVGDAVQTDAEHIKAFEHHSHMIKRASFVGALKDSFDQRSKMLRELSTLFVAGYFSRATGRATQRDVDQGKAAAGREAMARARRGVNGEGD